MAELLCLYLVATTYLSTKVDCNAGKLQDRDKPKVKRGRVNGHSSPSPLPLLVLLLSQAAGFGAKRHQQPTYNLADRAPALQRTLDRPRR